GIEIEGTKVPEFLYLVGKTGTWKWNNKRRTNVTVPYMADEVGMLYNRNFDAECIAGSDSVDDVNLRDIIFDSEKKYGKNTFIKKVSGINKVWTGHTQNRPSWFSVVIHGYNKEGREIYNSGRVGRYDVGGYKDSTAYTFPWSVTLPEHARVVIQVWGHLGNPYHDNSGCDNTMDGAQVYNVKLDDFIHKADGETNLVINEDYKPEYMKFNSSTIENLRPLALENSINGVRIASTKGDGFLHLDPNDTLEINGQKHSLTSSNLSEQKLKLNKIDLSYKVESGKIQLKVDNYGLKVPSPQPLNIKIIKHKEVSDIMNHRINLTVPYIEKVIGESFLEVKEYYPTSEYIKFNSCTLNNPTEIKLENSIRDVKLNQVTGKGLVNLEEGNILEVNGKRYSIGSGGNLSEKNDTLGDIKFKFKVEGGKLRLALNEWGILEPDRLLRINAEKIDKTPIMEHILKIRSPRRVEGTNNIKIDNNYQIRNVIKFSGISLNAPSSFA
ncbi:hypothetical protein, partial [Fusobacterium sp. SYSU M8D902]|uniref:hypothetical protein n=1 Tax=Fusobacterium sp. SYSU M8D902 TaxID=3159562 RepID=UPI0032E44D6B